MKTIDQNSENVQDYSPLDALENEHMLNSGLSQTAESLKRWVELGLLVEWTSKHSNAELQDLSQFIEEQAVELAQNFREISNVSKAQSKSVDDIVEHSTNLTLDGKSVPIVNVVQNLDELMGTMITDIIDISKKSMHMVYVMRKIVQDSDNMNHKLNEIFKITRDTKYLAINASIEAAVAGEAGKGFAVVANEVSELSKDTEELANSMSSMIRDFTSQLNQGFQLLEDIAAKDLTPQLEMKDDIDKSLQALLSQTQQQKQVLEKSVSDSNEINKIVSNLIMSMQFQDYAKQRIEHVVKVSDHLMEEVQHLVEDTQDQEHFAGIETELSDEVAARLLEKFSLSKIQNAFKDGLGSEDQDCGDDINYDLGGDEGDDIELF